MSRPIDTSGNCTQTAIYPLIYEPNDEVLLEIDSIEKSRVDLEAKLTQAATLKDYCSPFLTSCAGREFLYKVGHLSPLKILDIGFGRGETSLYLASQGHEVHAIEPSPLNCEILHSACAKYRQQIAIYQGTAEYFDQTETQNFDLCLFNSSLHHCDQPVKVLEICRKKLKNSGKVIAINEPILKFYRSKKWFYKKLESDPDSLGHYGGNEHIYYYHEYLHFFKKAGFSTVKGTLHLKSTDPRSVIAEDLLRKIGTSYVLSETKVLFKFGILLLLKKLWVKPILALGKKLSLFPHSFEATLDACSFNTEA